MKFTYASAFELAIIIHK